MRRLDIHLNIGDIPTTKKLTPLISTPRQMVDYIKKYSITHGLVLYRDVNDIRSSIALMQEEGVDCKLYPLKWIVDIDKDMADMENEPESLGVCVHSHRGTVDGKTFGLDYSGRDMHRIFKKLKPNSIVCVHTQGVNSYKNISKPTSVVQWATKYPELKFLIEHAGSYMKNEFYPTITKWEDMLPGTKTPVELDGNVNGENLNEEPKASANLVPSYLNAAIGNEALVYEAILASQKIHNIWLDTSIIMSFNYKAQIMASGNRWSFGSDWPFQDDINPVRRQEDIYKKYAGYSEEDIQEVHNRGIHWLETPARQLFDEWLEKTEYHTTLKKAWFSRDLIGAVSSPKPVEN